MDAACGPSNGVKSLQKHFEHDGSLHQSRVRSGNGPAAFRQPPNQAQLDRANQEHNQFIHASRPDVPFDHHIVAAATAVRHGPLQNDAWSQDFRQSLPDHYAGPHGQLFNSRTQQQQEPSPRISAAHRQGGLNGQGTARGAWGDEFLAMATIASPTVMSQQQQPLLNNFSMNPAASFMGFSGGSSNYAPYQSTAARQLLPNSASATASYHLQNAGLDESAFASAFAEAESSLRSHELSAEGMATETEAETATTLTTEEQDVARDRQREDGTDLVQGTHAFMMAASQEEEMASSSTLRDGQRQQRYTLHNDFGDTDDFAYFDADEARTMEEAIQGREQTDDRREADALANTAGDLIHALRDERSDKFKHSNFMALMHRLRDGEVVVREGRKMVEVASGEEIGEPNIQDVDAARYRNDGGEGGQHQPEDVTV